MRQKLYRYVGGLLIALALLVALGGYLFERLLPGFINLSELQVKIEKSIQEGTGIRVDIEQLSLRPTLFDGMLVVFNNNVLYDPEDVEVVKAGKINVNIRYLPLLFSRKSSISRIAFDDITVYVGERSFLFRLKRPHVPSEEVVLEDARIEFNDYHIFVDRYFDGVNKYFLHGENLVINHYRSERPLTVHGKGVGYFGRFDPNQRIGNFELYGNIDQSIVEKPKVEWKDLHMGHLRLKNLQLPTFSSILRSYDFPVTASGEVDHLFFDLHGLDVPKTFTMQGTTRVETRIELPDYRFRFKPGQLSFQTQFNLNPELTLASLKNLRLRLQSRDFRFSGQGNVFIKRPWGQSGMDIKAASTWLPIRALELFPKLTPYQKRLLHTVKGDFATNLQIKGILSKPQITGSVSVKDGFIDALNQKQRLAGNVKGTFRIVSPQHYRVDDLNGIIAEAPVRLKGDMNFPKRSMRGSVNAKGIDLAKLRRLILQFAPETPFLKRVVTTGRANVDLTAQGNFHSPQLNGLMVLNQVSLFSNQQKLYPLIRRVSGSVRFRGQQILLQNLAGWMGTEPLRVSGSIDRKQSTLNVRVMSQRLYLSQVQQTVQEVAAFLGKPVTVLQSVQIAGRTSLDLQLYGKLRNILLRGKAVLRNGQIVGRDKRFALSRLNAIVLFAPDAIRLERLGGMLHGIPISASGRIFNRYRQLDIVLSAPGANLKAVQEVIKTFSPQTVEQVQLAGAADVKLQLKGAVNQPDVTGEVTFKNAQVTYLPKDLIFQGIQGVLQLRPEMIQLSGIQGVLNGIPLRLNGSIDKDLKKYTVLAVASNVPIRHLQELLVRLSPEVGSQLDAAAIQSGTADLNLALSPDYPMRAGGTITLRNVYATPAQLGVPLYITQFVYNLATGSLQFPSRGIQIGDLAFSINGFASANGYQLRLNSQEIPVSFLRDNEAFIEQLLPVDLPQLFNTAGAIRLDSLLTPAAKEISIRFIDAGASMSGLKYPVYNINGTLNLAITHVLKASADNLTFKYGNSPAKVSFDINGLQDIYLETSGVMAPLLVNDIVTTNNATAVAYAAVPFDINLSGAIGSLLGNGAGNNLNMFFNFNIASLFSNPDLERPDKPGDASLEQATLSSVLQLVGDSLKIEQTRLRAGEDSSVLIEGQINELFDPSNRHMELSVVTQPMLDLAALARDFNQQVTNGLSGRIIANLKFLTKADKFSTQGTVRFEEIRSNTLEVEDLNGTITFDGLKAFLDITHLQIPGVDVRFTAVAPNLLQYPLPVTDFHLVGNQFIVSLYSEWISNVVLGKIRKGFWEQFFPSTGRVGSLPFEIKSGTMQLKEGIINNLIVENYTSNIRVYPNTYFELENASADSAGGRVTGHYAMNPRDNNFMTVSLLIDRMKANAVSRILLNVTNQIFGDLSGKIDYTTEGRTSEEMMANTNGFADLRVENGRLPSVARIENLLVAANTISGGFANLNLNSLFRLAAPFNTDYFATLAGTFKMVEGIIHTNDMRSDGENLDLFFSGSIRMVDGFANMLVRGEMDREIGGVLGPLGDISIGRFLGFIPPLRRVVSLIPGIGFIPGFGGPRADEGVAFEVKIIGPAIDPGSVQDFKWVQ